MTEESRWISERTVDGEVDEPFDEECEHCGVTLIHEEQERCQCCGAKTY